MRVATLILAVSVLQETPSLETMLERLFSYVTAYEARLSELIADEEMEQKLGYRNVPAAFSKRSSARLGRGIRRRHHLP